MENFERPSRPETPEPGEKEAGFQAESLGAEREIEAETEEWRLDLPGGFQADVRFSSEEEGRDSEADVEVSHSGAVLEKELDSSRESLLEYIAEINEIGKKYDSVYNYFGIPKGEISMEDEIEKGLAARREGQSYEPKFVFPKLAEIDLEKARNDAARLEELRGKVLAEDNADVREVALEIISNFSSKIGILEALSEGDKKTAFEQCIKAYGDIDDALIARAWDVYGRRLERNPGNKSDVQKRMEDMRFDADALKRYLDIALGEMGEENPFEVIVDASGRTKACTVDYDNEKYGRPVIIVPGEREVDGKKLLELIAHEVGIHAMTNKRHNELFGGLGMGSDWETVQEGFAKLNEESVMKAVIGDSYKRIGSSPYYVLAMAKARESIDKGGKADILEIYDHIFDLKKKDIAVDQRKLSRYAYDEGFSDMEAALDHKTDEETKAVLRRVFRGMYPYYFPKDKAYLEGEEIARKMRDAHQDGYEYESKADPKLLPGLIRLGFFSDILKTQKSREMKDVALRVWQTVLRDEIEKQGDGSSSNS